MAKRRPSPEQSGDSVGRVKKVPEMHLRGEILAQALKRKKLSGAALADLIGVDKASPSRWVNGKSDPQGRELIKAAIVLGVSPLELYGAVTNVSQETAITRICNLIGAILSEDFANAFRRISQLKPEHRKFFVKQAEEWAEQDSKESPYRQ